jgi:hypothetical protein
MTASFSPALFRRKVVLAAAAVVLALGVLPMIATPAMACSCAEALTDQEYADQADAAFVGRVDEVVPAGWDLGSSVERTIATFVVDEVYKGDVHTYTDVVTARDGASCGIDPVAGQTMVVFANYGGDGIVKAEPDELRASLCQGTRPVGATPIAIETIGYAPMAGVSENDQASGFPLLGWLSFAAVAGLGAMPIVLWMRQRTRLDGPEPRPRPSAGNGDQGPAPNPFA